MRFLHFIFVFFSFNLLGQSTISGKIVSASGQAVAYAHVQSSPSQKSTIADQNGNFYLANLKDTSIFVQAIGYKPVEIAIKYRSNTSIQIEMEAEAYLIPTIEIESNRVAADAPFSSSNFDKETLQKENLGTDVPFLLQWTPSMTVTSDAGTGIGYTSMRLRGSDQTRINVTINGVPLNDAESQNVFWVDLPDLMGSVNTIQIQRGVGASSNGAGGFGGTVSINTNETILQPMTELGFAIGSFGTKKLNINVNSGLIDNKYSLSGRYSTINSDGYVDRASADLESYSISALRLFKKSSLRFNLLSGKEVTYQSWNGVPEAKLSNDKSELDNHYNNNVGGLYKTQQDSLNLYNSGRTYNYYTYPNQVDDYTQRHAQLIYNMQPNAKLALKSTLYYTRGFGFFEQFNAIHKFSNYGLDTLQSNDGSFVDRADVIRRRHLSNHLGGLNLDAEYSLNKNQTLQSGIYFNRYIGDHFGDVINIDRVGGLNLPFRYYDNRGTKSDNSMFARLNSYALDNKLLYFIDAQIRKINYDVKGIDNDLQTLDFNFDFLFFNPKIGTTYKFREGNLLTLSLAVAHKEPSRSDFIDNIFGVIPTAERLINLESGYKVNTSRSSFEAIVYYMKYKDQLVNNGQLNDVGAALRTNVPDSYRLGLELIHTYQWNSKFYSNLNLTVSQNKINQFEETIYDYTNGFDIQTINHRNTDISFSPNVISSAQILYRHNTNFEAELSTKYVSRQYLDNTQDINRSIPSFHYQNLRIKWGIGYINKLNTSVEGTFMVNNIFNRMYVSNGYTYSYRSNDLVTENFLYPQAGRNFNLGIKLVLSGNKNVTKS